MAQSKKDRRLALEEAKSRRRDMLVTLPFFVIEKLISWPVAVVCLGYMFFVVGGEHFAGVETSLLISAAIDVGADNWIQWAAIAFLFVSNIVTGIVFKRYVARKGQREKALEAKLDEKRSSSGLDKTGNPPR